MPDSQNIEPKSVWKKIILRLPPLSSCLQDISSVKNKNKFHLQVK